MPRRDLGRQPRLACAAGPDERHQPRSREELGDQFQLVVTADEAGQPHRKVIGGRGWRAEFAAQRGDVDLLEFGGGVYAQLVGQRRPDLLVEGEGVGLPVRRAYRSMLSWMRSTASTIVGDSARP